MSRRDGADDGAGMLGLAIAAVAATMIGLAVVSYLVGRGNRPEAVTVSAPATSAAHVPPHVAAGAVAFVQFACSQCHGDHGRGGVSPDVPPLTNAGRSLSAASLRHIIDHGLGVVSDPSRPYMPVWGAVISQAQVGELVAYIKAGLPAVPAAQPPAVPTSEGAAAAGAALYLRYGCINCHGPNGLGGVPNPAAPDRTVPPLSGADFRAEFDTPQKIMQVIRDGSVLGKAPIVSMPHWGGILSPRQLQELTAYIATLK
jgi:mono/diheme cytochrome c family protein